MTPKGVVAHTDTDSVQAPGRARRVRAAAGTRPAAHGAQAGRAHDRHEAALALRRVDRLPPRRSDGCGRDPRRAGDAGEGHRQRGREEGSDDRRSRARQVGRQGAGRRLHEPVAARRLGPGPPRRRRALILIGRELERAGQRRPSI